MQFKEYNMDINSLLPPSYKDHLWNKHPAIILYNIVKQLNLTKTL